MACRFFAFLCLAVLGIATAEQKPELKKRDEGTAKTEQKAEKDGQANEQVPPEEDESLVVPKEYSFNPLQATKELQIGNFYYKKRSYKAAVLRFREATKWNNGLGDAWLRLAEAEEKLKDRSAAKEAYAKYLEVEPDSKNAPEIRKKLEKLSR